MKTQRDQQWELIQQLLANDITATTAPKFTSRRTLFGIKSTTEELIERVVNEENQRLQEQLQHTKEATSEHPSTPSNKPTGEL